MLGHASDELSLLRREQTKSTLKPEYYPICNTDIPNSQLLFGDDLAKRARDTQETSKLANKLISTTKTPSKSEGRYGQTFDSNYILRGTIRTLFVGKGQRPFHRKKKQKKMVLEGQRQEMLAELARVEQTLSKFEDFVQSLREYYHCHCKFYQAGGLGNSIAAWKQLTSDQEILRDISGVHIPCAYAPEQHLSGLNNNIQLIDCCY